MPEVIEKTQSTTTPKIIDFGAGPFSALMKEQFELVQHVFKLSAEQAEKYSRQLASDLGAIHRSLSFSVKTGKPDKDALRKITMAAKSGKLAPTPSVQVLIATQWISEAGSNNVSWGKTQWSLTPFI